MLDFTHPLKLVMVRVLEDWAMMLVDEVQPEPSLFDPAKPVFMSWVYLHGVMTGAVSIIAQPAFMRTLALNLTGGSEETDIDDTACRDAFREMGNVLAGNFLTEAYGDDVAFDLLDPSVAEITAADVEKFMSGKVVHAFLADGEPVAVTFSIKEIK